METITPDWKNRSVPPPPILAMSLEATLAAWLGMLWHNASARERTGLIETWRPAWEYLSMWAQGRYRPYPWLEEGDRGSSKEVARS